MPIPQTEQEIIGLLNLEQYGAIHPAPDYDTEIRDITILDKKNFTNEAIAAALENITDEVLSDLLQYPHKIDSHNNIAGYGGVGGDLYLSRILILASIGETRQRVRELRNKLATKQTPNETL